DHNGAEALDLGGLAQRAYHVEEGVAGLEEVHELGRLANPLDDEGDGPAPGVAIGDGQRDALAPGVDADDDELPGLALRGHPGRLDHEALDVGSEEPGLHDAKHRQPSRDGPRPRRGPPSRRPPRTALPPGRSSCAEGPPGRMLAARRRRGRTGCTVWG